MEGRQRVVFHILLVLIGTAIFCLTGFGAIRYNELYHPFAPVPVKDVEVYDHDRALREIVDELPRCAHSCMADELSDLGCAYSDYKCLCEKLQQLGEPCKKRTSRQKQSRFESCMAGCADYDQWISPALLLDMCQAVHVRAVLPKFMLQTFKAHGRRQLNSTEDLSSLIEGGLSSTDTFDAASSGVLITTTYTDPMIRTRTTSTTTINGYATIVFVAVPYSAGNLASLSRSVELQLSSAMEGALSSASAFLSGGLLTSTRRGVSPTASATRRLPSSTSFSEPQDFTTVGRKSSKFPIGAIAGIAIGVVIILLIMGALIFRSKKKQRARVAAARTGDGTSTYPPMAEVDGQDNQLPPPAYHSPQTKEAGKITVTTPSPVVAVPERFHTPNPPPASHGDHELGGNQHTHNGVMSAAGGVELPNNESTRQELSSVELPPPANELSSTPARRYASPIGRKPISPPQVSHSTSPPPWDRNNGPEYAVYSPLELASSPVVANASASNARGEDVRAMEEEMARIQAQRERLNQLHALEEREEELRRTIEARKAGQGT